MELQDLDEKRAYVIIHTHSGEPIGRPQQPLSKIRKFKRKDTAELIAKELNSRRANDDNEYTVQLRPTNELPPGKFEIYSDDELEHIRNQI